MEIPSPDIVAMYRDNLICLVYTDKWQASVLAISVQSLPNKEDSMRFRMKLNVS